MRVLFFDRMEKIVFILKWFGGKGIDKVFIKIYFEYNRKVGYGNLVIFS